MPSYGTVCVELFQGVVGITGELVRLGTLELDIVEGQRGGTGYCRGVGKEASALMWSSRCSWGLKTGSWVGNWEMASVGPHRGRNRYRDSILVGGSMRDD